MQRARPPLRNKLTVGEANDPLEREADRIADALLHGARSLITVSTRPAARVQRLCSACAQESDDDEHVRRQPADGTEPAQQVPSPLANQIRGLTGGGKPLPDRDRRYFESGLQFDFSQIRIHADSAAASTARALRAHAYTLGNHIFFASGRYAPDTPAGKRLLAHELVHTVQQGASGEPAGSTRLQRAPDDVAFEKWSPEIERQYRIRGDDDRARAVKACREQGGAECKKLLTISEVMALYKLASEAKGDESRIKAGLSAAAAPALLPRLAPPSPSMPLRPPLTLVPPEPVPPPGVGLGAGVTAGGVTAIVAILVIAGVQMWQLGQFEEELRRQGFIILEEPLGQCIGGCHLPARTQPGPPRMPRFDPWGGPPPLPEQFFPKPRPTSEPVPQPRETPPRKSPREKCQELQPGALTCDPMQGDRDEVVIDFLMQKGYGFDELGECSGHASFGAGAIDACDGAPGEIWHCAVKSTNDIVSVFGCLCCDEEGSTSFEWRGPHFSVRLGRRGGG